MAFFTAFTDAIASRQSLFVAGLDPNPEMLRHWASSRNLAGRSLLKSGSSLVQSGDRSHSRSRVRLQAEPRFLPGHGVRGIGAVDGSAGAAATGSPFDH